MGRTVEFKPVKGYEVINENLGRGAFGKTILIKDPSIDELFVCKKYEPIKGISKEAFFKTFKKEIKIMYSINHPNVIRIFTYYLYETSFTGYILMEYIDGTNIDNWFNEYDTQIFLDSNDVFRQLIEGFACLEKKGIVHRDIRESNILISKNDEVKIIDFGFGKNIGESRMSLDSFNSLINRYQMQKVPQEFEEGKYTSKTDMFCIAELFNRMLVKYKVNDFKHGYILKKMMNYKPEERYSSFNEILTALDKKNFKQLNISNEDRVIYNSFVGQLVNSLSVYTERPVYEKSIAQLLESLSEVLKNNCLNDEIENADILLRIFIKSKYKYYVKKSINTESLQKFYDWIAEKDYEFQQIIISNIQNRLSAVAIREEEDLPF